MDEVTRRRHESPDYVIHIHATGVKLPSGKISWRMHRSTAVNSRSGIPSDDIELKAEMHNPLWWAKLLGDWAVSFLGKARVLSADVEKT